MHAPSTRIRIGPLTPDTFAPFGTVIDLSEFPDGRVEDGSHLIAEHVAALSLPEGENIARFDFVSALTTKLPLTVTEMLRQRHSSVGWIPLLFYPFVISVSAGASPKSDMIEAFCTTGRQALIIAPGIWHTRPAAIRRRSSFISIGSVQSKEQQSRKLDGPALIVAE